jgi:hypothetical protein
MPRFLSFNDTARGDFDHHAWLSSIWRQAPEDAGVALARFLDYHSRVSHPLVNPAIPEDGRPRSASGSYGRRDLRAERIEAFTREVLDAFFWQKLIPLGCVETLEHIDIDGDVWFRLSSAGKFFFDQATEFTYGQPNAEAAVLVQPNFEIVFLQANLSAEIALAPLAERVGKHVGTLFRLTRAKAVLAASQGITAETALETLDKHSAKSVPANVAEEVHAWFGACREIATRRAVLIEAGDRETALRVQRLLGQKCVFIKDNLLEFPGVGIDPKLRRKLTEQGIFFS